MTTSTTTTLVYYTRLYSTLLCYNLLYYTILHYNILYWTRLYYTILYYTIILVLVLVLVLVLYFSILLTQCPKERDQEQPVSLMNSYQTTGTGTGKHLKNAFKNMFLMVLLQSNTYLQNLSWLGARVVWKLFIQRYLRLRFSHGMRHVRWVSKRARAVCRLYMHTLTCSTY